MNITITGSAGFLGKLICKKLEMIGHKLIKIDFANGQDITEPEVFSNTKGSELFIHLAAKSYVPDSMNNPADFYHTNIFGTLNVLEAARKNNARVIFFSSYIYGNPEFLPVTENHPYNPHNPYAQSKLIGEDLCRAYFRDFGVPTIIFRPFNIYGPGQGDNFLIPTILKQINSGYVRLMDPNPKRDYIHCDDIVEAVAIAAEMSDSKFEIFNLGNAVSISVEDIVKVIKKYCRSEFDVYYENSVRKTEVSDCYADIKKANQILNWTPKKSFETGIIELLKINDL
jgi:UDP-glucose 4-epimerase